jgi:hypothetical protein
VGRSTQRLAEARKTLTLLACLFVVIGFGLIGVAVEILA